ncbi:hypothetical protein BTH42_26020 [Burkholderia sp. SRS-W-2-2016]|nr:hypothetical protein BTH42_26020 [Burkholderia sp. SRS-W-2-2016]
MRDLVRQDPEAGGQYQKLFRMANQALNDTPNPVPQLVSEGKLQSNPEKVRTIAALKDMPKISALAWVWLVSQDERYATKGSQYILAWAQSNRPDGDPINETTLEPLVVAYDVLRPKFTPQNRAFVDGWLHNRAVVLWNDPRHRTENWQSHRLKMVGLIATVVHDDELWKVVADGFQEQMDRSFLPDGETTDFGQRDAMHYQLYGMQPLLTLACVAQQRNHDWYHYQAPSGASLKRAVGFVEPYALGEKTHVEFVHSKVKFDKARAQAGEKEYMPHNWDTCEAGPTFVEAGCVDPNAAKVALQISCGESEHKRFVDWESVLNYVKRGS